MNDIVNVISTVGFPIACCVVMGYYVMKEFSKLNDNYTDLLEKSTTAIVNNTNALYELKETIKEKGDDLK